MGAFVTIAKGDTERALRLDGTKAGDREARVKLSEQNRK